MKTLYIATWITDDGSTEFYPFVDNAGRNQQDLSFDFLKHYALEMGLENEDTIALEELNISCITEVYEIGTEDLRYVVKLEQ